MSVSRRLYWFFLELLPLFLLFWIGFNIGGIAIPAILGLLLFFAASIVAGNVSIPTSVVLVLIWFQVYEFLSILYLEVTDWKRLIGFFILQFAIFVGASTTRAVDFGRAALVLIFIFSGAFYVQFGTYYLTGIYLNFGEMFGLDSRNLGGTFVVPMLSLNLMRASGLFTEPGNYTNVMALLLFLYSEYSPDTNESKWVNFATRTLAPLSLLFSFSAFGLVYFIVLFALRRVSFLSVAFLGLVGASFILPYFIDRFIERTATGNGASGVEFRLEYFASALSQAESLKGWLIGEGTLSVPTYFSFGGSDNDAGLFLFILREFGVLTALAILIAIIVKSGVSRRINWLMIVLLATKLSPFMPLVGFLFGLSLFSKREHRSKRMEPQSQAVLGPGPG
jgi:hypothetical protein